MNRLIVFLFASVMLGCAVPDEKKIAGRWQSDDVWYEYFDNKTYNSGRSVITMIRGYKYTIDQTKKELTMYTDDESQTYYLQYRFEGNDTLMLNNVLNSKPHFEKFYRVKQ